MSRVTRLRGTSRVTLAVGLTPPCSLACACPLVPHGQVASGIAVKHACAAYGHALRSACSTKTVVPWRVLKAPQVLFSTCQFFFVTLQLLLFGMQEIAIAFVIALVIAAYGCCPAACARGCRARAEC